MKRTHLCGMALLAAGAFGALAFHTHSPDTKAAVTAPAKKAPAMKPVETDMHEFMEYIHKPTYMRLRTLMASKPKRSGWRKVKAESLVLAEAANLLLVRPPDDEVAEWNKLSVENRDFGAKLYQAAKKKNYDDARKHYTAMIQNCNLCHKKFAGGEHQLKP